MSYRIGIDVGGTFTDFLLVGGDGARLVHKTPSTPADPSVGVVSGLEQLAAQLDLDLRGLVARTDLVVHGTTVTTNATLTRRGAATGLLTTRGFRDTLALRDGTREETYDNRLRPPEPLVPRYLRLGVTERTDWAGQELEPLAEDEVRAAADLFAAEGREAVAICFMHAPQDPSHERRALELVRERLPDAYVTASSDLLPQVRFYERTSTTVLNAYVGPIITRYLRRLTGRLEELGFTGVLLVMQSNGGVGTPPEISRRAALSLLSGPASGPAAGLAQLEPHGWRDCITIDMGGTSFDAAPVKDGQPLVMTDGAIDRWRIALPMIDIHTIGAGGGSIAAVDEGGLLHVGPDSAGADPGPACYGRGGTRPTVTDADLVLGYLDEASFAQEALTLDADAARRVVDDLVARPLGLPTLEAAAGIYDLINVTMAAGVRDVTVRRGLDPREFPLVVAGGAGPLHAAAIAAELEIPLLVVPRESSIFCASGMLMCDFKHDHVRAFKQAFAAIEDGDLATPLEGMAAEGRATLAAERVPEDRVELQAAIDLRYVGQWHELTLPFAWRPGEAPDRAALLAAFHAEHDRLYGYASPQAPVESLAVRLTAVGRTERVAAPSVAGHGGGAEDALAGRRPVWSPRERRLEQTPVYDGDRLSPGATLAGPAIIELAQTTIVVLAGFDVVVDRLGSFVLHAGERGRRLAEASHLTSAATAT